MRGGRPLSSFGAQGPGSSWAPGAPARCAPSSPGAAARGLQDSELRHLSLPQAATQCETCKNKDFLGGPRYGPPQAPSPPRETSCAGSTSRGLLRPVALLAELRAVAGGSSGISKSSGCSLEPGSRMPTLLFRSSGPSSRSRQFTPSLLPLLAVAAFTSRGDCRGPGGRQQRATQQVHRACLTHRLGKASAMRPRRPKRPKAGLHNSKTLTEGASPAARHAQSQEPSLAKAPEIQTKEGELVVEKKKQQSSGALPALTEAGRQFSPARALQIFTSSCTMLHPASTPGEVPASIIVMPDLHKALFSSLVLLVLPCQISPSS